MGTVFRATDQRLGGEVAVKVLHAGADPTVVDRLRREARAAAALGNPHIVRVTDFQANAGEPAFIVMEKIEGVSVKGLVDRDGRVPVPRACAIASQMLSALGAAHAAGIVHRDVKPENVLLGASPTGDVVKMVDFGLAHSLSETATSETVGSFSFIAPEHLAGGAAGPSADLYAVGATLFFLLSGRRPFDGLTYAQWSAVAQVESPRLAAESLGLPEALATIVARAMSVRPENRFANANDFIAALAPFVQSRPAPIVTLETRPMRAEQGSSLFPRLVMIGIVVAIVVMVMVVAKSRAVKHGGARDARRESR